MRFICDLTKVKIDEIYSTQHAERKIQAIIAVHNPKNAYCGYMVVFTDGNSSNVSLDGRQCISGPQLFAYKPRLNKRLKPLHRILSEQEYKIDNDYVWINGSLMYRIDPLSANAGQTQNYLTLWGYPDNFFEETVE